MSPPHGEGRALETRPVAQYLTSTTRSLVLTADELAPLNSSGGPLWAVLEAEGVSLQCLTVLAPANDPFRVDTPSGHRDGAWLANTLADLGLGERKRHLRGLHYMLIGQPKPNGEPYTNTDPDWQWLGMAAKCARWLGYIPFGQVTDERNAAPEVRTFIRPHPLPWLTARLDIEIPDDITPVVHALDFRGTQPYKLVLVGEKSSLKDVLGPLAESYEADLYLPTGEISDTQASDMARIAVADGRRMVVAYFSDCDPSGWQMAISLARKLQGHKVLQPTMPDFELHQVALTPDQVREYGLPSTPLKGTERRADAWQQHMGVEQTEIDALASLRPDLLAQIAREALDHFFDHTLAGRVNAYWARWLTEAREVVANSLDPGELDRARRDAQVLRDDVDRLNERLSALCDVDEDDFPEIVLPEAHDPGGNGTPLLDSRWPFAEQCRALKARKAYAGAPEDEPVVTGVARP